MTQENEQMLSVDDFFQSLQDDETSESQQREPFKFLDPYTAEDRSLFFGRDLEIAEIYRKFYASPLLLVYGESGSGKTSLIQCGLQSEIPQEEALYLPVRTARDIDASLRKELQKYLDDTAKQSIAQLFTALWKQQRKTIVLILDQFEEFFLFHTPSERQAFIKDLIDWQNSPLDLRVIISIREEYYARLTELEAQIPELYNNRLWVRRMSRQQAHEVITKPCEICNIQLEDELTQQLLKDLTQDDKEIDLPTLQVVLDTLYKQAKANSSTGDKGEAIRLSLAAYKKLGKISKILANFIDQRIASHKDDAETLRQVLKAMVTAQGTRKISQLQDIQQRLESFGVTLSEEQLKQHLQQLSQDRIIREDSDNGLYELRHDSLANTIYTWMTGWEKELIEIRQDIENRYQEYCKRKTLLDADFLKILAPHEARLYLNTEQQAFVDKSRKHNRRKAQRRIILIIATLLAVLATVSVFWYQAEQQRQAAEKAKQKAILEREKAIELINYMNFDLRDKLKPIGKLYIMDDVQRRINRYFDSIELDKDDLNTWWQKAVAIEQYAETLRQQGKAKQAMPLFEQANQVYQTLVEQQSDDVQWQRALSVSYNKLGDMYLQNGEKDKALKAYQDALAIGQKIAESDPDNVQWQRDLVVSYVKLSDFIPDKAKHYLQQALHIVQTQKQKNHWPKADDGWEDIIKEALDAAQ